MSHPRSPSTDQRPGMYTLAWFFSFYWDEVLLFSFAWAETCCIYRPGWTWTRRSVCLRLPSAGITHGLSLHFFLLKVVSLYSPGWPQIWSFCLSLLSHEVLPCLTKFPFSESVKTSPINIKHAQGPASQVWRRTFWLFGRFRRHNQGLNMHALFFANRPSSWLSLLSRDGDYGYVQHHPQPYRQQRPLCLFST